MVLLLRGGPAPESGAVVLIRHAAGVGLILSLLSLFLDQGMIADSLARSDSIRSYGPPGSQHVDRVRRDTIPTIFDGILQDLGRIRWDS